MIPNIQPKISIAMAVYNGEKFLREQLDSIYAQTVKAFEVIAVDDCSSDNSVKILQEYAQTHGLKIFRNEKNLGVNGTFEKAISLCAGDFIAPSDQDDIWLPKKLEECYNAICDLPREEISAVSCLALHSDEIGKIIYEDPLKSIISNFEDFFPRAYQSGANTLFNKKLKENLLPFNDNYTYDMEITALSMIAGNRIVLPKYLRIHRHHSKNLTSKVANNFLASARFKISMALYSNRINDGLLNVCYYLIQNKNLQVKMKKLQFISQLKSASKNPMKILSIKEFSFSKRLKCFASGSFYKMRNFFRRNKK